MYIFFSKKYIIRIILFTLLSLSSTWAAPRLYRSQDNSLVWENIRVNIDFGFGIPEGKIFSSISKECPIGETKVNIETRKVNSNLSMLFGYDFSLNPRMKIGGEIGVVYGFTELAQIPYFNIHFKEKHLYIPILFTYTKIYNTSFYLAATSLLGYEFDILLASNYEQSEDNSDLPFALTGDKNIKELFPEFCSLAGNIISSSRLSFPKGIYAQLTVKLPLEMIKYLNKGKKYETLDEINYRFLSLLRFTNRSFIQIHIGVNIMDWLYPKERLQPTSGRRFR